MSWVTQKAQKQEQLACLFLPPHRGDSFSSQCHLKSTLSKQKAPVLQSRRARQQIFAQQWEGEASSQRKAVGQVVTAVGGTPAGRQGGIPLAAGKGAGLKS